MIKNKLHLYKILIFNDETAQIGTKKKKHRKNEHLVNRCYSGVKSYRNYYLTK